MTFHYRDPDGDQLEVVPFLFVDGPYVALQITDGSDDNTAVRIPLDRVEELITGIRDTARQAARGQHETETAHGVQ